MPGDVFECLGDVFVSILTFSDWRPGISSFDPRFDEIVVSNTVVGLSVPFVLHTHVLFQIACVRLIDVFLFYSAEFRRHARL